MSTGRATLQSQLPLSDEMPSWNREEFKHSRDIYLTVCFFWLFLQEYKQNIRVEQNLTE